MISLVNFYISYDTSQVMINNWLVNPTGKPNAWVPVDLLQEHMNFWIKVVLSPSLCFVDSD